MEWIVEFHNEFEIEFSALPMDVQDEVLSHSLLLQKIGPQLGRPRVDTLKGSKFSNMKEFRFSTENGVWRVAFAFDRARKAILLIAGDKSGVSQKRFYKTLIKKADARFEQHLTVLT